MRECFYFDKDSDVFNSFLRTFLIIFQAGFPFKYERMKRQEWMYYIRNKNILKIKRGLYAFSNNSTNPKPETRYVKYYKTLRIVIKHANKQHYSRLRENLTFICPCVANIFSEYNQKDEIFLNLFIFVRRRTCFRRFFFATCC